MVDEDSIHQQHNGVVVVEERGTPAGLRQAPQETRRREVGLRQGEIKIVCLGQPKPPTIYRRRGGGCAPSRVPTPRGAAALAGMEGGRPRGGEGGAP